ncbi:MAG: c-type cytochrome [Rhodoplanes sp.]
MRRYPTPWLSLSAAAFCLLAALAAAALVAAAANAGRVAPEAVARLDNLVRQDCGSCHGLTLKGGLGKPLTADSLAQWDREQLTAIILDGVPGTPMPPWRPLLTEAEAHFIADMLKEGKLK